jgi:hypothetical protein
MGIGIYRYPIEAAAEIAIGVLHSRASASFMISLVVFDEDIAGPYKAALNRVRELRHSAP